MESVINSSLTTTTTTTTTPKPPVLYVCKKTSSCGCGKADVALTPSRIVGGENAIENSWPMIVSLRLNGTSSHSCGGTILSNSYILTAAHCLLRMSIENPTGITIAAGMTNRSDPLQIIRNVDRIYMHPNYTSIPGDYRHDIALLHIDSAFVFEPNSKLTKTCIHRIDPPLLTNQYPENGTRLSVIGWGTLRFQDSYLPEILQQVQVFTIDNQDPTCVKSINNTELQFCAGLVQGGKGQYLINLFQNHLVSFFIFQILVKVCLQVYYILISK
jgi:secreted trypsin-like serine protease